MPKDDWKKATISQKIKGRSREKEQEAEAARDASVDEWIARRQEQLASNKKKRKKR